MQVEEPLGHLLTLVINLDRSPDRLTQMADRLGAQGLAWQRVPAVEGKKLDVARDPRVDPAGYRRLHGKGLNPAEVGCYLSHVTCWQQLLANPDATHALIVEDDCEFSPAFRSVVLESLHQSAAWDLLRLSGIHRGTPVRTHRLDQDHHLAVMLSRQTGSAAYLINRNAARVMLERLVPMQLPLDHAFNRPWLLGIRERMVCPLPAWADPGKPSTIGYGDNAHARLPWYQRTSTYRYRVRTELRRVGHALSELLIRT
jgi:glycosyl transferase, family 25